MIPIYDYIAANLDGTLWMFVGKPKRGIRIGVWFEENDPDDYQTDVPEPIRVPKSLMPNLTWDDEPVEIKIVRK